MGSYLNLAFDTQLANIQGIFGRLRLFCQPVRCPADKVGGKEDETFL